MGIFQRLSAKLIKASDLFGTPDLPVVTLGHYCPACDELHHFAVDAPFSNGARWTFDGNVEKPTFNPSMDIRVGPRSRQPVEVCHYFLHEGRIQYLGDCTHEFAGTTVELQDIPATALQWMKEAA